LLTAWAVAAFGTTKGMITGHLFRLPPSSVTPVKSVKEPHYPGDIEDDM